MPLCEFPMEQTRFSQGWVMVLWACLCPSTQRCRKFTTLVDPRLCPGSTILLALWHLLPWAAVPLSVKWGIWTRRCFSDFHPYGAVRIPCWGSEPAMPWKLPWTAACFLCGRWHSGGGSWSLQKENQQQWLLELIQGSSGGWGLWWCPWAGTECYWQHN